MHAFLDETAQTLAARGLEDSESLLVEVARQLGKLMAYKDEYEVARLYTRPEFRAALADQFGGSPRLKVHLAPPLLPLGKDARTGRPRKIALPGWLVFPLFGLLRRFKGLRGGALDIFGYSHERRMERALIGEYRDLVRRIAAETTPETLDVAVQLATAPELVAGYGAVKDAGIAAYRARVAELLPRLGAASLSEAREATTA